MISNHPHSRSRTLQQPVGDTLLPPLLADAERLPLLICGVAGVVGLNTFTAFRQKYGASVVGQRAANNWPLRGDGIFGCDLEDRGEVRRLLEAVRPRAILNCGGSCALKSCERDPDMAWRVNVESVRNLLDWMGDREIRLVHCSIDLVFSGNGSGGYRETDEPDPVTVYGHTMVESERLILDRRPDASILRISLPMGVSFNGHAGAIDWIQSRFAKGKPATLYFDEVRTPTYVDCLSEVSEQMLAGEWSGIYHAGGPRALSLFQIAQIVNRVGGYRPELLQGCPRHAAGPIPPRAGNVTLNSERLASALGRVPFQPWPLLPEDVPEDRGWHFELTRGCPQRLAGSLYRRPCPP